MRWERDCSSLEEMVSELLHKADQGGYIPVQCNPWLINRLNCVHWDVRHCVLLCEAADEWMSRSITYSTCASSNLKHCDKERNTKYITFQDLVLESSSYKEPQLLPTCVSSLGHTCIPCTLPTYNNCVENAYRAPRSGQ